MVQAGEGTQEKYRRKNHKNDKKNDKNDKKDKIWLKDPPQPNQPNQPNMVWPSKTDIDIKKLSSAGIEPTIFCVLSRRPNQLDHEDN